MGVELWLVEHRGIRVGLVRIPRAERGVKRFLQLGYLSQSNDGYKPNLSNVVQVSTSYICRDGDCVVTDDKHRRCQLGFLVKWEFNSNWPFRFAPTVE